MEKIYLVMNLYRESASKELITPILAYSTIAEANSEAQRLNVDAGEKQDLNNYWYVEEVEKK